MLGRGGEDGIHLRVSLLPGAVSEVAAWMDPAMLFWEQLGWAQEEGELGSGPCPGLSRQAWLASSLALGKPSFLAGLAFKPDKGGLSLSPLCSAAPERCSLHGKS